MVSECASTLPELGAEILERLPAGTGWAALVVAVGALLFLLGALIGLLAGCLGAVLLHWRWGSGRPGTSAALARLAGYRRTR